MHRQPRYRPAKSGTEYPAWIRKALADLIRDYQPVELSNYKVDFLAPDYAVITADVPSNIGQQVVVEVIDEEALTRGPVD